MNKFICLSISLLLLSPLVSATDRLLPEIDGDWWQVAGDPDLGDYTSPRQQPVDFGVWQAADGTWQLWSCIRHTKCGGSTRLFYRWEGQRITDRDWMPKGIAMEADTSLGETKGGLQAPHVILLEDTYYMIYGDWQRICLARSEDGKEFTRVLDEKGQPDLFSGPYGNSRDPMVLRIGDLFHCYYMGHRKEVEYPSAIFCRTSHDLHHWSEAMMVSAGGVAAEQTNWYGGDAECPFVLEKNGLFYLFRNQRYGESNLNTQYCSPNPFSFGVGDDRYRIGTLAVAAPEIIRHGGEEYIAALLPSLKGIRVAKLGWRKPTRVEEARAQRTIEPLMRSVDLDVGESERVVLADGKTVTVKLLGLEEQRCEMREAVRRADAKVEVDGQAIRLSSATYHLPRRIGAVQIDCPVTRGYTAGSSKDNVWALDKDVRLRLWPADSPWIRPGTFGYPVNQRWFASDTQMANDPCYVNACDVPGQKNIYYHYGLDFGGVEGLVNVLAATDGIIISRGGDLLSGDHPPQVKPRHDVVYIRDDRGWYYRYSHLKTIRDTVVLGRRVRRGEHIGMLGKEGGSGGWSHLHFDIAAPQPSGRYGITDGYAFAFQAYREQHHPQMIAVARPHLVAWAGEVVTLDASRSWHADGPEHLRRHEWRLCDGRVLTGRAVDVRYGEPGHYTEVLRVSDDAGLFAYDFAVVQVFDREAPTPVPPAIHAAYWPTTGIRAGDEVVFSVRSFGLRPDEGEEIWDFGDGSPASRTQSDGNARQHAPDGYAIVKHKYEAAGDYLVTVRRENDHGETATGRLWVRVDGR